MTNHSSAELDPNPPLGGEVPLSDRPLMADDQNTVVSGGNETGLQAETELRPKATAEEIRDRLFAPPDSEQNPERGLKIAHFEVIERIGSGGMGAVFRATDLELHRDVALKVMHPSIAADPSLVARFRNEARACAQLNHDNLARVFFTDEQDGVHFIAYEFADGQTIKELIVQHGRLNPAETVNYAIQATLALSHVDAAGIVHRDIKPSNIILTSKGRVKVVDLGLARRDIEDSIGDITVAGTTLGTFDYMSPEQARDPRTTDIRSDIYSLGCTVYHMLTGRPPYPDGNAFQKVLDHQGKAPPDPRIHASEVPPELAFAVQKMMNTNPDRRYQDPGQVLADLMMVASRLGLKSVPAEGLIWRRMPVRRVRELSGAVFLTGAVLVLCVTALLMQFGPANTQQSTEEVKQILTQMQPDTKNSSNDDDIRTADEEDQSGERDSNDEGTPAANVAGDSPFMVIRPDRDIRQYYSLAKALGDAKHGDEIVLDFDGPLDNLPSTPTRPDHRRVNDITLRAADGRHPVIEFGGDATDDRGPQMFYLSNGQRLTAIGIEFRCQVPQNVEDAFVLFQSMGANHIRLENCCIQFRNPARQHAAIVRISDAVSESGFETETSVILENTVVRGVADVLRIEGQPRGRVEFRQSAFALDGSIINNTGTDRLAGDIVGLRGRLQVEMKHVSGMLTQPLLVLRDVDGQTPSDQARDLPDIRVDAESCVFSSVIPNGVFVSSLESLSVEDFPTVFVWNGHHNLYHQFDTFWDRATADPMSFADWVAKWTESETGAEEDAAIIDESLWRNSADSRAQLLELPAGAFESNRSRFFGDGADLSLDGRPIPGADRLKLPEFYTAEPEVPEPGPAVSPDEIVPE